LERFEGASWQGGGDFMSIGAIWGAFKLDGPVGQRNNSNRWGKKIFL
jgi:hypothetical protein